MKPNRLGGNREDNWKCADHIGSDAVDSWMEAVLVNGWSICALRSDAKVQQRRRIKGVVQSHGKRGWSILIYRKFGRVANGFTYIKSKLCGFWSSNCMNYCTAVFCSSQFRTKRHWCPAACNSDSWKSISFQLDKWSVQRNFIQSRAIHFLLQSWLCVTFFRCQWKNCRSRIWLKWLCNFVRTTECKFTLHCTQSAILWCCTFRILFAIAAKSSTVSKRHTER